MRIALYAHGGSGNHGCEAIALSTIHTLGVHHDYIIVSERSEEDIYYGLNKYARIVSSREELPTGLGLLLYKIRKKLTSDDRLYYRLIYRSITEKTGPVDLAIAIGGDNYCYTGFLERFSVMNTMFLKREIPIALWGCSIDPERLDDKMLADLRRYKFITARESITYQSLRDCGLHNVYLVPDTAFSLTRQTVALPDRFIDGNTVGINISPLIISHERIDGIVMRSFEVLIDYILNNTSMDIALIPHVVWDGNDDRVVMSAIFDKYSETDRITMMDDCSACELKGYISRCRFMIAARTHASIAGYSSLVPTLVLGYSVKSRGIAQDLFGSYKNYVLPVEDIFDDQLLLLSFIWMSQKEQEIKSTLIEKMRGISYTINNVRGLVSQLNQE